jgi:hypothetical protein
VQYDGTTWRLDPQGNAKAAELVRTTARKSRFGVTITGELNGKIIAVASISAAP